MNASDQNVSRDSVSVWHETNGWRQGSVFRKESAVALGLIAPDDQIQFAMVISHDCDCAADPEKEPDLEIVIGSSIKKLDGSLTYAKSTRKLHLALSKCDRFVELQISARRKVSKYEIVSIPPDEEWILTDDEKFILAQWLAARYNRASFPTALVNRLRTVDRGFREAVTRYADDAVGIFVGFDPPGELPSDSEEPYVLDISIVFDDRVADAQTNCRQLSRELEAVFKSAFRNDADGLWASIELARCDAIADTEFTYRDSRTSSLFRLDHISLRSLPPGPLPRDQA